MATLTVYRQELDDALRLRGPEAVWVDGVAAADVVVLVRELRERYRKATALQVGVMDDLRQWLRPEWHMLIDLEQRLHAATAEGLLTWLDLVEERANVHMAEAR